MHENGYFEFSEDVDKEIVQEKCDEYARKYSTNSTGLCNSIIWKDIKFNSREEAEKWINEHDYAYAQIAVRFKTKVIKHSKAYNDARKKVEKNQEKIDALENKIVYSEKNTKSKYVSCKNCGSKLAVHYIRTNYCPVCSRDLRTEKIQAKLKELNNISHKLNFEFQKARNNDLKNRKYEPGYKWLVKIEYHV